MQRTEGGRQREGQQTRASRRIEEGPKEAARGEQGTARRAAVRPTPGVACRCAAVLGVGRRHHAGERRHAMAGRACLASPAAGGHGLAQRKGPTRSGNAALPPLRGREERGGGRWWRGAPPPRRIGRDRGNGRSFWCFFLQDGWLVILRLAGYIFLHFTL